MLNGASTVPASGGEPLLYVAELLHRVSNEYASAISLASVMASRAPSPEVRSALKTVIEHLVQLATAHRVLLPPVVDGTVDLGDYLTRLCQAKVAVELERRGTTLRLAVVSPVALEHSRCWRVGLIVSELITNAARHGLPSGHGEFSFRLLPTPARSSAGSATTARLQRPSGQASEHVSSMRLPWNSTVMLSDDSVTREQR